MHAGRKNNYRAGRRQADLRVKCDEDGIRRAVDAVRSGGVIVFPTDTVYGMGCDPYDAKAVGEIFRIKGRDPEKPLPLLAHSIGDLEGVAALEGYGGMTSRFWPGPLTIVAELRDGRLRKTMGLGESIAVGCPTGGASAGYSMDAGCWLAQAPTPPARARLRIPTSALRASGTCRYLSTAGPYRVRGNLP
ncbi:translation factor [Cenarchaeum symbiosum A]|uniref:L-threonylcarbamoyladenylate synthase n=1 Tax=Cenarchaeum symbiosum (strain A) TaxID=414004 RepID=A0RY96_CENSY|nr:translation factor [Cenarchaeum symbiosum A]